MVFSMDFILFREASAASDGFSRGNRGNRGFGAFVVALCHSVDRSVVRCPMLCFVDQWK